MANDLSNAVNALTKYLSTLGTLRYPKKQGSKGLFVYNPSNLDTAKITALASAIGWTAIHKETESKYFDPVAQEMKTIPPSVLVCPAKPGVTTEEANDYINNLLG